MHEYHIIENVVKQAVEAAGKSGASGITRVELAVGELSGLEESSIRLYFDDLSKGTLAEKAELVIKPVRAKLRCKSCDTVFTRGEDGFNCPDCGSSSVKAESGKEFYIENIEIESP